MVGHLSAHRSQVYPQDFGLPSWPVKPAALNASQVEDIQHCRNQRQYLLSFLGRPRVGFPEFEEYLKQLHKQKRSRIFAKFSRSHYQKSNETNDWGAKVISALPAENQTQDDYINVAMESTFAPTPRGDNLYSVRFSEILSAGTIPVIFADGWVLPYNGDVVNWTKLAVMLPQHRVNETLDILNSISLQEICRMQQGVLQFYQDYVLDSKGRLRAILELMDARLDQRSEGRDTTPFSAAPGRK